MKKFFLFLSCAVSFILNGLFFYQIGESLQLPQFEITNPLLGTALIISVGGMLFIIGGITFDGIKSYSPNQIKSYYSQGEYFLSFLWVIAWMLFLSFSIVATKSALDNFISKVKYNTPAHRAKLAEIKPLEFNLNANMNKINSGTLTAKQEDKLILDNSYYRRELTRLNKEYNSLPLAGGFIIENEKYIGWAIGGALEYAIFLLSFSIGALSKQSKVKALKNQQQQQEETFKAEPEREPKLIETIEPAKKTIQYSFADDEIKNAILTKQVACTYAELTETFRISRRKIKIILTELVQEKRIKQLSNGSYEVITNNNLVLIK